VNAARELPLWPPGTVAVLTTAGAAPHAIPVSTAVRLGPRRVALALARTRASLERLRTDPRCALTLLAGGDVAFTAHARATIAQDPMAVAESVVAVLLEIDDVQDHADPRFTIDAPLAWRWVDRAAAARDAAIRAALADLDG
jgi:flavin reductase (DIM6/NTAB) family NADH-FMN oxidoreductase RutF